MNPFASKASQIGDKVGIDPMLISGLILALIQLAGSCLSPSPDDPPEKLDSKKIKDFLEAKDCIIGIRWSARKLRRRSLASRIRMYCSQNRIFGDKADETEREIFREIEVLTDKELDDIIVNAGIRSV